MRSSVLLSSLCLSAVLSAQPVLKYDNVGLPGSVYDLYAITVPGDSDFELEGPDADQDFMSSVVDLVGAAVFTYTDFTPFGSDYPDAEVALLIINNANIIWERITIGMAEQRGLLPMSLAPNPASTFFLIPGLAASAAYRVIDALGRETLTGRVAGAQETIDVSALRPGIYRVVLQDARGMRTATLMKG